MTVRLRSVVRPHYVTAQTPDPRLPYRAKQFWNRYIGTRGDGVDAAIVACEAGKLVGFLRYLTWPEPKRLFDACGTWVDSKYRRTGLAQRMWMKAIRLERPKAIIVVTGSKAGTALVRKLQSRVPSTIEWDTILY